MRVVQADEFKKMAQLVVDGYLKQSIPLEEGLAKVAIDQGLNPDQIKNLVQLANTMAHLTLFDQKTDGDKVIEFVPADPAAVIKRVFTNGEPPEDASTPAEVLRSESDFFSDLPDLLDKVRDMIRKPEELMTAPESETKNTGVSPTKRQMLIIRIRKVASELENKKHETAFEYKDTLDKLASDYAKLYGPSYAEFEKDALALRGELALPVLADMRRCLRLPRLDTSPGMLKSARVVDSESKPMKLLDRLIKLNSDYENYAEAQEYLTEQVGPWL